MTPLRAARRQPVPAPRGPDALQALLTTGVLVDLAGNPLSPGPQCTTRPGADLGDTCPQALVCPTCGPAPSRRCRRPSGYTTPLHKSRLNAADKADQDHETAGDVALPARWAPRPLTSSTSGPPHNQRTKP